MSKVLQWVARNLAGLRLGDRADGDDDRAEFEQVDGQRLRAEALRSSASMRLDALALVDFSETIPAYSLVSTPLVQQERRTQRAAF